MVRYAKMPALRVDLARRRSPDPSAAQPQVYEVRTRLGPATIAQLVAEYEAGEHTTDLVAKYRVGKGTVIEILHNHGVQMRRQGLAEAHLAAATERYLAGGSPVQIAAQFGCSPNAVRLSRPTSPCDRVAAARSNLHRCLMIP